MELQYERRAPQDRRNHLSSPRFPFVDGEWNIVRINRRTSEDRRSEEAAIDENEILRLLRQIDAGVVKLA